MYTLEVITVTLYIYIYQDMYTIQIREQECNSHIYNQFLLSFRWEKETVMTRGLHI